MGRLSLKRPSRTPPMRFSAVLSFLVVAFALAACGNSSTAKWGDLRPGRRLRLPVRQEATCSCSNSPRDCQNQASSGSCPAARGAGEAARRRRFLQRHHLSPGDPRFMAQTGEPTGTGTGGSKYPDLPPNSQPTPFERGTVGAARSSSPNSPTASSSSALRTRRTSTANTPSGDR